MMKRLFSGYIYTWGDSYFFHLGHDTRQPIYTPRKLDLAYKEIVLHSQNQRLDMDILRRNKELLFKFKYVSTGPFHVACITDQGQLFTFGENNYLKLGYEAPTFLPNRVLGLMGQSLSSVSCGLNFTLALSNTGKVFS